MTFAEKMERKKSRLAVERATAAAEGHEVLGEPFKPDPDSRYRRGHWPAYAYPEKKFRGWGVLIAVCVGLFFGLVFARAGWAVLGPMEHHMLYGDEADQIGAKWEPVPITIRSGLSDAMLASPYYGTDEWNALSPVVNEDGSVTFKADTKEHFQEFVLSLRACMDGMIADYTADESFPAFGDATVGMDYYIVTVSTPMEQPSLIDQSMSADLLRQMKVQALFYDSQAEYEPVVELRYVNRNSGAVVLSLTM